MLQHLEGNDRIERAIPKRKLESVPGDRAQRRRAAPPCRPDRRGRQLHRNGLCTGMPGEKVLHRDRRARAYLEHRQLRLREHGIHHPEQPVEVRRCVGCLLKCVSFVALVKRGHGSAYLRIRHCGVSSLSSAWRGRFGFDGIGLMRLLDVRIWAKAITWRTSSERY